jgi:hypothetical protein
MKFLLALVVILTGLTLSSKTFACENVGPACVELGDNGDSTTIMFAPIETNQMGNLTAGEIYVHANFAGQDLGSKKVTYARGGTAYTFFTANRNPHGRLIFYFYDLHGNFFSNNGQNYQIDL